MLQLTNFRVCLDTGPSGELPAFFSVPLTSVRKVRRADKKVTLYAKDMRYAFFFP